VQNIVSDNCVRKTDSSSEEPNQKKRGKRILVVDDSLTVGNSSESVGKRGYEVDVAVDGVDGWNAIRTGSHESYYK